MKLSEVLTIDVRGISQISRKERMKVLGSIMHLGDAAKVNCLLVILAALTHKQCLCRVLGLSNTPEKLFL